MPKQWQTVNLTVGDPNNLGHAVTQDVQIRVNASAEDIRDAFATGSNILGFNLIDEVADAGAQKDGDLLPRHYEAELRKAVGKNLYLRAQRRRGMIVMTATVWARLFMYVVQLGNKDIRYRILEYPTLLIGGYDIFAEQAAFDAAALHRKIANEDAAIEVGG